MAAPANLETGYFQRGFGVTEVKALSETDGIGTLEAVVSVFGNIDRYKERIVKGAFKDSLEKRLPYGVWMHRWDQPVAKTLEATEKKEGLFIKGQFNLETQRGREAYSDVKNGLVDQFSIGFRVQECKMNKDEGVMDLTKLELFEWSPVLVGANPATRIVSVKDFLDGKATEGTRGGLRFADHSEQVLELVKEYVERAKGYSVLKTSDGGELSADRRAEFVQLRDALTELIDSSPEGAANDVQSRLRELMMASARLDSSVENLMKSL